MPELRPCPFCGHKVDFVHDFRGEITGIYCSRCMMKAQFNIGVKSKRETFGETMEKWAVKWNARAGDIHA